MFDNVGLMFTSIFINTSKYWRKMKKAEDVHMEGSKDIKIFVKYRFSFLDKENNFHKFSAVIFFLNIK